jgi:hypothetical protein
MATEDLGVSWRGSSNGIPHGLCGGQLIHRQAGAPVELAPVSFVDSHPFARKKAKGWGTDLLGIASLKQV